MLALYRVLAVGALGLHLLWLAWVVFGWVVTRNRPVLRWLHIGSLVYGILIEVLLWPCPLTLVEQWARQQAGAESYQESFLIHYLEAVIYPEVSQGLVTGVAVALCLSILGLYAVRFRRRDAAGW